MCLFILTLLLGPRIAIVLWWILEPGRFDDAFNSFVWPLLGLVFLPWTTLMFMIGWSWGGGLNGWDWLFIGFGALADFGTYASGSFRNRGVVYR